MTLATLIYYPTADVVFHLGSNLDLDFSHQADFFSITHTVINDRVYHLIFSFLTSSQLSS